jgi:hypothetical protein
MTTRITKHSFVTLSIATLSTIGLIVTLGINETLDILTLSINTSHYSQAQLYKCNFDTQQNRLDSDT